MAHVIRVQHLLDLRAVEDVLVLERLDGSPQALLLGQPQGIGLAGDELGFNQRRDLGVLVSQADDAGGDDARVEALVAGEEGVEDIRDRAAEGRLREIQLGRVFRLQLGGESAGETTARVSPDQGRGVGGDICEAGRGEGRIPSEVVCQEGSFRPQSIRNRHVPSVLQAVVDGPQLQACEESVEMRLLLRALLKGIGRRAARGWRPPR